MGEGNPATCRFDLTTTPLGAIDRAIYALSEKITVEIRRAPEPESVICELFARQPEDDALELAHLLRREVNDQKLRVEIAERTQAVRDLVLAVAFSRTGLVEQSVDQE